MEIILNNYHRWVTEEKMKSVASWQQHPISHEACLTQFRRLREQRLASLSTGKIQKVGLGPFSESEQITQR